MFIASTKIPEREGSMSTARLIVPHVSSFIYSVDELSFKGVTTWGKPVQDFILLFCVWCKSRELGDRGSSRFSFVTPVMETFSSDRVVFRIPSNISDGALLHIDCFRKKAPPQTSDRTPNTDPTGGGVNVGCVWTAGAWNSLSQAGVQESGWGSIKLWE